MTWEPGPITDEELAEMEREGKRTALWDEPEKEELRARLSEAHRERGLPPPPPLP